MRMSNKLISSRPNEDRLVKPLPRRAFLRYAGASTAVMALVMAGCKKSDNGGSMTSNGVNLGSGDTGILNYAYALEQLEAAFYIQVITTPYSGMSSSELTLLSDIRDHEIAHREFFKTALSTSAIASLEVNFSNIDFSSRSSVLATAKAFEDLGVSAYNGAGALISNADYLTLAGKIVSVEARHAAYIRELVSVDTFVGSDVVDGNGMEMSKSPADVLAVASAYIKTQIDASDLPTN
jgi:Ferritin-like domain